MMPIQWDGPMGDLLTPFCLLLWTFNVPFLLLQLALVRVQMVEFRQDWSQQSLE